MKLLRGIQQHAALQAGTVATIGNFDGVHRGHQALLRALRIQADRLSLPLLVVVFEPQSGEYFLGETAPARLTSLREKIALLQACGVDFICCLSFDDHLASMTAQAFAERIVFSLLQVKYLLIGEDFRFGHRRLGDVSLLRTYGSKAACVVEHFSDFFIDNERISSTRIRKALHDGELEQAKHCLGRVYSLSGRVIQGEGRGRQWGVPTANLAVHPHQSPLKGVYCVQVMRKGRPLYAGIANLGCRPTFNGMKNSLEVHLFGLNESLYGERLQVVFLHKLRDEIKFSSVEALVAHIHQDVVVAKTWFGLSTERLHA